MPPKRKREGAVAAAKKLRVALAVEDVESGADKVKEQKRDEPQFVHEPYKSDATFLSLVDDCFYSIFDRLTLHDLCSVAQTCKQLQQVSSGYFLRRHKSKVLIIENVTENGELKMGPDEEYVDVFATSCRNVTLGRKNASTAGVKRLTNFFRANKMEPIKSLRISGWKGGLTADQGSMMANMFTQVESFTLADTKVVGDLHDCILQYLPNMNRLTISKKSQYLYQWMESHQWLQNTYPKLRHFAWHTDDKVPIDLVRVFLQTNPGIRSFSLQTNSETVLQELVQHKIRVNELFYYLSFTRDVKAVFAELQKLCSQQGTRLHLKFSDGLVRQMLTAHMAHLTQLSPYVDGLFFEKNTITKDLARALTKFDNLKVLQLCFSSHAQIVAEIPTLQELYAYWGVAANNHQVFQKTMMKFASSMPHLKRIYIRNNSQKFQTLKFDEMDAARKQLDGACKLKIHVRTDELRAVGALNDIQREYDTIDIERVESEEVKNPLVTEYLIGKHMTDEYVAEFQSKMNYSRYWWHRWW